MIKTLSGMEPTIEVGSNLVVSVFTRAWLLAHYTNAQQARSKRLSNQVRLELCRQEGTQACRQTGKTRFNLCHRHGTRTC